MNSQWWNKFRTWLARAGNWMLGSDVTIQHTDGEESRSLALPVRSPAVDILESSEELLLRVDVPGASSTSARVTLHEGVLTIRARVDDQFTWSRTVALPQDVDGEAVRASLSDGVLTVNLAKRARVVRTIPVRATGI